MKILPAVSISIAFCATQMKQTDNRIKKMVETVCNDVFDSVTRNGLELESIFNHSVLRFLYPWNWRFARLVIGSVYGQKQKQEDQAAHDHSDLSQ